MNPVITVQDLTTPGTFTEVELERMVWAIRYQLLYQFNRGPWVEHGYCQPIGDVKLLARGETPPPDTWHAELLDTIDVEGALGFHEDQAFKKNTPGTAPEKASERSARGFRSDAPELPLMKIGVQTSKNDGVEPSEVLSHEVLESAVDPRVMVEAEIRKYLRGATQQWYIGEICDAVQGEGYDVGAQEGRPCGVPEAIVSNYVNPGWFDQPQTRPELDFRGSRKAPWELAAGGYISVAPEAEPSNWSQIKGNASAAPSPATSTTPAEHDRHGNSNHEQLLELLLIIDQRIGNMEDVLAGIAADEAELATIVPKLIERDEQASKKLAEFEARSAAGEVVPAAEVETLKGGFDQSIASLKALLPAEPPKADKTVYTFTPSEGVEPSTSFSESGFETVPVPAEPAVPANPETGTPEAPEVAEVPSRPLLYCSLDTAPGETNGASIPGYTVYAGPIQAAPPAA